ncbi:hypothetical protein Tco_0403594 [Tanacetum coccineum]
MAYSPPSPLMYKEGDASTIRDLEFERMTLISNGLMEINDDFNLAECIALAFKNEKLMEIFLEHHGYDLSHRVQIEIEDDGVSDVGEMEDISAYGVSDFVGEDDVVIPNRTINDSFLNKLCNETFISNHTDTPKCSEPTNKELLIDSDDVDIRCGGKKGDSPAKKRKANGVQIESPSKGKKGKGVQSQSPGKKGIGHPGCKMEAVFISKP